MCDPASLAGAALSIAGSVAQAQTQAAYVQAQNKADRDAFLISKNAREAEIKRQDQFQTQAETGWLDTVNNLTADQQAADKEAAQSEFLKNFDAMKNEVPEGFLLSGQDQASDVVKKEIAQRANTAAADARDRVAALAALSSYGNVDLTRSLGLNDNSNFLTTLGGLRRGSLGVSGQEQAITPVQVTPGHSYLGDILSGVGGLMPGLGGAMFKPPTMAPTASIY